MKKGKRYNIVKRNIAVGMLLAMLNSMLFADIKVDKNIPQNTNVDRAQNGANIVNINCICQMKSGPHIRSKSVPVIFQIIF